MKLLIANSNISSNVGNDFFYRGVKYVLNNTIKDATIFDSYFQPFNAYHLKGVQRENNFDYFSYTKGVDAIVICGPVMDKYFAEHFEESLKSAKKEGKLIFMLSIGSRNYDKEEIEHCSDILKKYPPDILISRDSDTFKLYGKYAKFSYDGICFAFFADDYYKGYKTDFSYLVSCFDFAPEPDLKTFININQDSNTIKYNKAHGTRSLWNRIKYRLQRDFLDNVNGLPIVRPCHRPLRKGKDMFFKPMMLSSFATDPYLNLYLNTQLTITDRLHAAVVTLVFGNKACLLLNSNRTRLLDRVGIAGCKNNVYSIDDETRDKLKVEKTNQVGFLRNTLDKLLNK